MKKILFLIPLFLFAKDVNETKLFWEKYNLNERAKQFNISPQELQQKTKDFNLTKLKKINDMNESEIKQRYNPSFYKSNSANKIANSINNFIESKKFQRNVKSAKDYILYDKGFNFSKYEGQYKAIIDKLQHSKGGILGNKYLDSDERIYVVISSSIPKTTIKNYFAEAEPVGTDIHFVLRGLIGGIHKIKPTLKWLNSIIVKNPDGNITDPKNRYQVQVEVNPKVTMYYGIKEVPAVIFVKGFNPLLEAHEPLPIKKDDNESVYIAYGDANLMYSLKKINKVAKSKGLADLIKHMKQGFFQK